MTRVHHRRTQVHLESSDHYGTAFVANLGIFSVLALVLLSLPGCWGGTIGVFAAAGGGDGSTVTVIATAVQIETPTDGQSGRVPVMIDAQFDPKHALRLVSLEYSLEGVDGTFRPATLAQGFPTEVLAESAVGTVASSVFPNRTSDGSIQSYQVDWNSHLDIDDLRMIDPDIRPASARAVLRLTVRNDNTGRVFTQTTNEFFLDQTLVRTVVGGGVGDGNSPGFASMLDPTGVAVDSNGDLFVADSGNNRLRKITIDDDDPALATAIETAVGNGFAGILTGFKPARKTSMATPIATVILPDGGVFMAENDPSQADPERQGVVRYTDRATGLIRVALSALVQVPADLGLEGASSLFVSDQGINGIREFDIDGIDPISGDINDFTEFSGALIDTSDPPDGTGDESFTTVAGIAFQGTPTGRSLFVADRGRQQVLRLDLDSGIAVPFAGGEDESVEPDSDAIGANPRDLDFTDPLAVALNDNFLFIADKAEEVVVVVRLSSGLVSNVLTATEHGLVQPTGIEVNRSVLYVCEASDFSFNTAKNAHRITAFTNPQSPANATVSALVAEQSEKLTSQSLTGISAQATSFQGADQTNGCSNGNPNVFIDDEASAAAQGAVRGQAADVPAAAIAIPLARPEDVVLDPERQVYYVADTGNGLVCKVRETSGLVTGIAGSFAGVPPDFTERNPKNLDLARPVSLALDQGGGLLFIANASNQAAGGDIVRIRQRGVKDDLGRLLLPNVTQDADALLEQPVAVAWHEFNSGAETLFVADSGNFDNQTAPRLLRVNLDTLDANVDPGTVEVVDLGDEFVVYDCNGADFPRGGPGFPIAFRAIHDIHPVPQSDGSLVLLLAADLIDNFLEFGSLISDFDIDLEISAFEANCHDGVDNDGDGDVDEDDDDCGDPMREVILALRFDATGALTEVRFLVYGFKRFTLDSDTVPDCGCGSPAFPSFLDFPQLVIDRITARADLRFVYASDPCCSVVNFVEVDLSLADPIVRFGTAAGTDVASASSFDGLAPLDTVFGRPRGLAVNALDDLYIADVLNNRIRRAWMGDQINFR